MVGQHGDISEALPALLTKNESINSSAGFFGQILWETDVDLA